MKRRKTSSMSSVSFRSWQVWHRCERGGFGNASRSGNLQRIIHFPWRLLCNPPPCLRITLLPNPSQKTTSLTSPTTNKKPSPTLSKPKLPNCSTKAILTKKSENSWDSKQSRQYTTSSAKSVKSVKTKSSGKPCWSGSPTKTAQTTTKT